MVPEARNGIVVVMRAPRAAGGRRLHRIRPAAVRAQGGAGLPQARRAAWTYLAGGRAGARCAPHRLHGAHRSHPGIVGEDRPGGGVAAAPRRGRRLWRHPDGGESISRAAGAAHGQTLETDGLTDVAARAGRPANAPRCTAMSPSRLPRWSPAERGPGRTLKPAAGHWPRAARPGWFSSRSRGRPVRRRDTPVGRALGSGSREPREEAGAVRGSDASRRVVPARAVQGLVRFLLRTQAVAQATLEVLAVEVVDADHRRQLV